MDFWWWFGARSTSCQLLQNNASFQLFGRRGTWTKKIKASTWIQNRCYCSSFRPFVLWSVTTRCSLQTAEEAVKIAQEIGESSFSHGSLVFFFLEIWVSVVFSIESFGVDIAWTTSPLFDPTSDFKRDLDKSLITFNYCFVVIFWSIWGFQGRDRNRITRIYVKSLYVFDKFYCRESEI